jgi:hypothetical protein
MALISQIDTEAKVEPGGHLGIVNSDLVKRRADFNLRRV